ncbi:MAG: hypothetical protein ACREE0_13845 [Phenylobacterium sp.]
MDYLSILTSGGHIGFRGRIHADYPRPTLLMVAGAFPRPDQHQEIIDWFREANVLVARLPGMGVPSSDADARGVTVGLEEAVRVLLGDRPLVVCGGSASGLVTIPMRGNIHRKIILDPFLRTEGLWPLLKFSRKLLEQSPDNQYLRRYLWTMFGFGPDAVENRDYRDIVDAIDVPTDVLVGEVALQPERALVDFPSLTSVDDRALLAAHPLVTMHKTPAGVGHDLWSDKEASRTIRELMSAALQSSAALL